MQVLMIDDDLKLGQMLQKYLAQFDIQMTQALNPDDGISQLKKRQPDLVLLDIMLPGRDGLSICREIRTITQTLPVLMLTARGDTADKILGLELGADDYLAKPFDPRELAARMTALHRRSLHRGSTLPSADTLCFDGLTLHRASRQVILDQSPISLTHAEFELLWLLASRAGEIVDRDQIVQALGGMESDVYSRSVDILVSRLRSTLEDTPKNPRFIKTAWRTGYVFVARPVAIKEDEPQ